MTTATGTRERVIELTGGDADYITMMSMYHTLNRQHLSGESVPHDEKTITFTEPGPHRDSDPIVTELLVDTLDYKAGNTDTWRVTGRWTDGDSVRHLYAGFYDVPTRTLSLQLHPICCHH